MKIIDLLNMISKGEDLPEKFKFAGQIFEKQGSYIEDEDGDSIFDSMCTDFSNINEEIEEIGEDNKIEKLENMEVKSCIDGRLYSDLTIEELARDVSNIVDKINEIIDKIQE